MHCGNGRAAQARAAEGFELITVGVDSSLFNSAVAAELAAARAQG